MATGVDGAAATGAAGGTGLHLGDRLALAHGQLPAGAGAGSMARA